MRPSEQLLVRGIGFKPQQYEAILRYCREESRGYCDMVRRLCDEAIESRDARETKQKTARYQRKFGSVRKEKK